jgi:antitoxin ParD1/3/4
MPIPADEDDAIDPEYVIPDEVLRRKIDEALKDPRPSIPSEEVFERLKRRHAALMKGDDANSRPR